MPVKSPARIRHRPAGVATPLPTPMPPTLTPTPTPMPMPTQKRRNEWQHEMDGSGNWDGRRRQDCNGRQQRRWATAAQWVAEWRSDRNGRWDGGGAMDGTIGGGRLPLTWKRCTGWRREMGGSSDLDERRRRDCDGWWQRRWATRCNGRQDSGVTAMGNGTAAAR